MSMKRTGSILPLWIAIVALSTSIWLTPATAQTQAAVPPVRADQDDLTRQQLAAFDQFLDSHPELAGEIRKDPSLVNNDEFVANHADLQNYLKDHPEVREDLRQNPAAVMHQEQRFDRREDRDQDVDRDRDNRMGATRAQTADMDQFLDSHPEIAEQLRKDPSLVDNKKFVQGHPALQQFLTEHPELSEQLRENPNAFMHREERFDRQEDRRDMATMDQFLDKHPEIAEQLRKNPSLIENKEFVENHPALKEFMAAHPDVRLAYQQNPTGFMKQEQAYDRREDGIVHRDRDVTRAELSSFNEFLGSHNNISTELSRNPSLATNQEFLENHPELKNYLQANPRVSEELKENPQSFVKSAQAFEGPKSAPKILTPEPKSK